MRDHYTMGLLYAEHATFSDPVFQLLNARHAVDVADAALRAEDDFGIDFNVLEDSPSRAKVDWSRSTRSPAPGGRSRIMSTEMQLVAGKIVRQEDKFSLWRWSSQALGTKDRCSDGPRSFATRSVRRRQRHCATTRAR